MFRSKYYDALEESILYRREFEDGSYILSIGQETYETIKEALKYMLDREEQHETP